MIDFYIARLATLGMDMGIMFVFVTLLGCNDKIMKIIVQFVVTIANYVFAKLFVFKKGQRVAKEEQKPEE
jgi:putative flippase GtrA